MPFSLSVDPTKVRQSNSCKIVGAAFPEIRKGGVLAKIDLVGEEQFFRCRINLGALQKCSKTDFKNCVLKRHLGATTSFFEPHRGTRGYVMPCQESLVYSLHFWFSGLVIYSL